jgi:hypothetical protein
MKNAASDASPAAAPFVAGAVVVVTLHTPREKFWGAVVALSAAGLAVCGVDLNSFEDFASLVKAGEAQPCVVFFPMHRIERVELDAPNGAIPAIAERFAQKSGHTAASVLRVDLDGSGSARS